jgi:arylsulfatase A-like enzyme
MTTMMGRRDFLRTCGAAGLGAVAVPWWARAGTSGRRPNVLILLADDMGFSDAGCYGGEIATPNLDRLAANGLRFTQFYNTARCWPTRACILTGYYAQQVGMDPASGQFPPWTRLVPQQLQPLGYRSYHSGKWHVHNAKHPVADGGFNATGGKLESPHHGSDTIAAHAIECLKDHAANHAGAPFFSYVCFTAPHFPLHAWRDDIAQYRDRYHDGWDVVRSQRHRRLRELGIANCALPPLERDIRAGGWNDSFLEKYGPGEIPQAVPWDELTAEQKKFQALKMAIHAASVDRMDREIGRILDQLAAMNALEDTLVFFLSDNGASAEVLIRGRGHDPAAEPGALTTHLCLGPGWSSCANTPFRRHKIWVHEGGIATPLIAHWPKGIAAHGELRHDPGHCVDFAPTIYDLAGHTPAVPGAPPCPGRSLRPAFARDGAVTRDYLFFKHSGHQALRVGDWKIVGEKDRWALYDLRADRAEQNDLAGAQPERLAALTAQWQKLDAEFAAQAGVTPGKGGKK